MKITSLTVCGPSMTNRQRQETMMNRLKMAVWALVLGAATGQTVQAETLQITGRLVPAACTLETIPMVTFDDIGTAELSQVGKGSAPKDITLQLTHCPAATTQVKATLSGTADDNNPQLFKNAVGTGFASGLGIEVTDLDHGSVIIADQGSSTVAVNNSVPTNRTATFTLRSRLVSSKLPVTAGKVQASVTVGFTYQ